MQKPLRPDEEREELVAYLDGELSAGQAARFEARLSQEPKLRAEVETLRKTWELLEYLPRKEPSPAFTSKTLQRVSALHPAQESTGSASAEPADVAQPRKLIWRLLAGAAWAASIVLALGGGFVGGRSLHRVVPVAPLGAENPKVQQALREDLHLIENVYLYEKVEDLALLRELADPDLFGDDL